MSGSIIFHHPHPIVDAGASGSKVRPYQMLQAFRSLGYDVEVVAGGMAERHRAISRVRSDVRKGRKVAFTYAEASTMPTLLTEDHHFPIRPLMDAAFFRWLHQTQIPLGLFYRDVHWRFEQYHRSVPLHKRALAIPLYLYEWSGYKRWVDHLFLPSLRMLNALPSGWPADRVSALPPGCSASSGDPRPAGGREPGDLELFYVGGVTPPLYDLRAMLEVVEGLDGVRLTLCCRNMEWARAREYYSSTSMQRICVVHDQGENLTRHYSAASAMLLFWQNNAYLDFAVPVKLLEAIGFGMPVITTAGTEAARFVNREGIGWVVATREELAGLLARLRDDPSSVIEKRTAVLAARERNSWQARARRVAEVLDDYRSKKNES